MMFASKILSLLVAAGFAPIVAAQLQGWEDNEVNTTMCTWQGLRAAVIRDTLYMDGGYIYWRPGLADGSYGSAIQDHNYPGISYMLNFSTPFDISQNISALFTELVKGSAAPLYYDGAMLANNDEYFLFGGLLTETNFSAPPASNQILEWQQYAYGIDQSAFSPSWVNFDLTGNITRYIAYGGAANVPSENLAFYFSGLHGPTWDDIFYPSGDESATANETSDTLITLNMATQGQEKWTNVTLPSDIPGRANPELVWVPVGKQGILVALGGVVYPEFVTADHVSDNMTASEDQSPAFMTNINIYDIANETWYTQTATGGPGALTQGCAVMQPAEDYSSFNIYWYGGYDGLHATDDSYWNDAVWILSLPSFTWKQASANRTGYARAGHKCVMPYPDQMMVIGGQPAQSGYIYDCVPDIIQIFNVSSAEWLDRYDPRVWSNYAVPSVIYEAIGGDGSGGATSTAPKSWDTSGLGEVFQTAYATSKITTYYPYPVASTSSVTNPTYTSKSKSGSGVPKFLAPLLGVLLGLIFVSSLAVGIIVWRRRKLMKKNGGVSLAPTDDNRKTIMSWINGQRLVEGKAETVTTSDELAHSSPTPDGLRFNQNNQYPLMQPYHDHQQPMQQTSQFHPNAVEMSGDGFVELPADPPVAELSDTPASANGERHLSGANPSQGARSSAYNSSIQNTDQGSIVSSTSFQRNTASPPAPPSSTSHATSSVAGAQPAPAQTKRSPVLPESAVLPKSLSAEYDNNKTLPELPASSEHVGGRSSTPAAAQDTHGVRGSSGVSVFSERERAHLRNLSDPATVSTMDATITGVPPQSQTIGGRVGSPPILEEGAVAAANATVPHDGRPPTVVSPPTGSTVEGEDYLAAGISPMVARGEAPPIGSGRRSAFRESQEDLGGGN